MHWLKAQLTEKDVGCRTNICWKPEISAKVKSWEGSVFAAGGDMI